MTTPKHVRDTLALLQRERQTLQARLDAIDLCVSNLSAIWPEEETPVPAPVERRTTTRRTTTRRTEKATNSSEVDARGELLLAALRRNGGVGTAKELRKAIPAKGLTDEQVGKAFTNAMYRLKSRGLVDRTGHTWSLNGAGSETIQ